MILFWLIVWLAGGGLLAWAAGRRSNMWPRWISLVFLVAGLGVVIGIWARSPGMVQLGSGGPWLIRVDRPWIPQLGMVAAFTVMVMV